jgi:transglutaminase-like putative cysteine protease
MNVGARRAVRRAWSSRAVPDISGYDLAAGACTAVVAATYLSVLYEVVGVVGDRQLFVGVVVGAVGLAGVLRALPWKYALALASSLLVGGLALYLTVVPPAYLAVLSPSRVVFDTIALLTGYSVLRMPAAGAWALAVAPAPTFLVAYFGFRREYSRAVGIGAVALGFFVLTGDSTTTTTLVGVLAAAGAVAFGTLAVHGATARQTNVVAVVLAVMILGSATVTAVPGGTSPLVPASSTTPTGSLVSADSQLGVGGSLELDPTVQFTVTADEASYYRTQVYDRFTGNRWVRTSGVGTEEQLPPPTGEQIRQTFTAQRTLDILPSAAEPMSVDGIDASVTEGGLLESGPTLRAGDSYSVTSREPVPDRTVLANETGPVPAEVRNRYLQVPGSTDDQVVDLADDITAGASSNYEQARAVEQWLEANKEYSLDVDNPRGNLVNHFLLHSNEGYCTYYASSMAVMLRSQDVPTRMVVGYTSGQRVEKDQWVVRGTDSHAWVEVYIPDRGWVRFDPTPAAPRTSEEQQRVEQARESGMDGVDAAGSENGTWTPTDPQDFGGTDVENISVEEAPSDEESYGLGGLDNETTTTVVVPNVTAPQAPDPNDSGGVGGADGPSLPPLTTLAIWGALVAGLAVTVRYTGVVGWLYRTLWLRWLPSGSVAAEIDAAYDRAEYVMERRYRERNPGETVRSYVADVRAGDRAERLVELRERARYAERADRSDAEEAKRLARSLAAEYSRLPGPRR